ncbi:TPA: tail fiber protein [Salmonella enterica subsp. enterica serovar Kottbus]
MKPLMPPIDTPDQVFHDGNPSTGELGTICSAEWLNNVQANIRNIQAECIAILNATGFTPDSTNDGQLWAAIQSAIKSQVPAASMTTAGVTQLSSSVTSDSESVAATLKAVKIAMDNANARLAKERNLADLTNIPLARQSLQLGNSATRNVGTTANTVAAGDDSRILAAKKAIDDTQTGLAVQGVMWISTADDLSNLPSGARRFARNNTGVTVLPAGGYFFLEVLAKRDTANGSCILATSDTRDVWIGFRYAVPDEANFTWIQLNQSVQNLGLTDAVNRALNAVQKNGDTMTGNLFLKNNGRMHFAILDEDGNARMWFYKDKGGDGVRLNNGYDGGGEFVFGKNSEFYSPSHLHAGDAMVATDGNVYGTVWGGWLNNNVNGRATWDWVNQNFITRMKRGEPVNPGKINEYGPAEAPAGCVVTSVRHDPTTAYGIYFTYRPLSVFINGGWRVIEG